MRDVVFLSFVVFKVSPHILDIRADLSQRRHFPRVYKCRPAFFLTSRNTRDCHTGERASHVHRENSSARSVGIRRVVGPWQQETRKGCRVWGVEGDRVLGRACWGTETCATTTQLVGGLRNGAKKNKQGGYWTRKKACVAPRNSRLREIFAHFHLTTPPGRVLMVTEAATGWFFDFLRAHVVWSSVCGGELFRMAFFNQGYVHTSFGRTVDVSQNRPYWRLGVSFALLKVVWFSKYLSHN